MLIQIVLFDGFDLLDALAPYEVFTAAGMASNGAMQVELVSVAGAVAVRSGPGGLPIPASGRPDLERSDIILIPGAAGPTDGEGPDTVPAILAREAAGELPALAEAAFARSDKTVATVCGGSLVLALAGMLRGRPAVTHHLGMALLEEAGAIPVKARVVDSGNLVTGGGVTSGLDVALHLVERTLGPRISHSVEALFEYERRGTVWRDLGQTPRSEPHPAPREKHGEPVMREVQAASADDISGRWDVSIATPLGQQKVVYDIASADGALTGTATQGNDVTPLFELTASGNRLTWMQHVTKPMRLTLRFDVLIDGDALAGSAKAGVLPRSQVVGSRRRGGISFASPR